MKYRNFVLTAVLIVLMLTVSVHAVAEKNGEILANTCLGCHGVPSYTNVYPSYKVPKLAGQHKEYIISALQAYRSGNRSHPTMKVQSMRLSYSDITAIAAYFGQMKSEKGDPNAMIPENLKTQVLTCAACHSNDGNSLVPTFPRIAGQHESYIYQSLTDYKSGKRNNPIMLGIVSTLSDNDMKVLAKYFASRKGLGTISLSETSEQTIRFD